MSFKWYNLKSNKCPKCNRDWLVHNNANFGADNVVCKCGFKITSKRMSEIVNDKVNREILESMENDA